MTKCVSGTAGLGFSLFFAWLSAPPATAQTIQPGTREYGIWAGYSPASPTLIGTTTDRELAQLGLRFGFFFARSGPVTFEYTADFVPVTVVLEPAAVPGTGRNPVYGFGFAPVGFKFHFGSRRLSPFFAFTGGMIYTTEPVPLTGPDTTQLNFMFDFGGGVQWVLQNRAMMFGYKLHHISNANRTAVNPGLDSNVLYVGYSFLR